VVLHSGHHGYRWRQCAFWRVHGYSAQITGFNTAALVIAGKMRADCNDLRIARFAANTWTQLDRQVINCNTASSTIWFKLQADIAANGADASYSLFYGNANAPAPPANLNNVYLAYDNFDADTLAQPPAGWTVQGGGLGTWWPTSGQTGSFVNPIPPATIETSFTLPPLPTRGTYGCRQTFEWLQSRDWRARDARWGVLAGPRLPI